MLSIRDNTADFCKFWLASSIYARYYPLITVAYRRFLLPPHPLQNFRPMEFGELLRKTRLDANIGLRKFAKMIGELPSNLSAVETGKRPPWRNLSRLRTIADALAIPEGSREWDRFMLSARPRDVLPEGIDRILERDLVVSMLRTVEEFQLSDEQLEALIDDIRSGKIDARRRSRKRTG